MDCPQCGRPLATGARQCVYCAHGTKARPREQISVPRSAMAPRKGGIPWRPIIIVAVIIGAFLVCMHSAVKPHLQPLIDGIKSLF
jgi:uncharacterized membrane protein YvbJ